MREYGAGDIYCSVTHPVLSGNAAQILENSILKGLTITNTLPLSAEKRGSKTQVLSVASLLGEAIHRIHGGLSIGAMFGR